MNALRCVACLVGLVLALSLEGRLQAAERFDSVFLSEFLADNQRGLQDDDGDRSGWIELCNGGTSTMNLDGWFLTDSPTNLARWRFPKVALLPGKCLLVFASGKGRATNLAFLHANFRLDPKGSYLALVNRATNVVSEFAAQPQQPDTSYGRARGEPSLRGFFPRPTPGKPNASSGAGLGPEVSFSKPGGSFWQPFSLELKSAARGAVIRYTLDGSLPTSNSPAYGPPLLITNSVQVRARTYQPGLLPGPPGSESYVRLATNVLGFTSTLPLLIMDTFGRDTRVQARSTAVHLSFFEPVNGRCALTNRPTLTTRAAFRVRGSTSAGMPQPGFAVEFLDEFGGEQAHAPLGLPADSDWVLYAPNGFEPVMIHNPFIHQLSRDLGQYSPRTCFVEVFLVRASGPVTEAHYGGIYVLEEKIKIGPNRVAIDELGAADVKPPAVTGGYLLKFDRLGPGEGGLEAGGAGMVYVDPQEEVIELPQRAPQREYLRRYFDDFERALHSPKWRDPREGYRAYFDVDAGIDFHVVEVLSGNVDCMAFSTHFYKPRGGKLTFGPHWDFDRALGSTDGRDANPRRWNIGPFFGGAWWPRMFSDVDFWQLWVDRWQKLRRTHFSPASLDGLVDRLSGELKEAQPRQERRWDLHPRGGSYQSEVNHMKRWLADRADFVDRQLAQPPRFDPPGGRFTAGTRLSLAAAPGATIYYTLDGTDPRLAQGEASTNALIYREPIELLTRTRIVARARDPKQRQSGGPQSSTPWSGPVAAGFAITPK
jgi:hypothetical protein